MIAKTARKRSAKAALQVEHAANGWLDVVKDMSADAGKTAARSLEHLRDNAEEYLEEGLSRAVRMERSAVSFVRRHPLQSLAIAAGATMLCSFLFLRRSDDE